MGKNKLARFAENETFNNLFQHTDFDISVEKFPLQGNWQNDFFKNENPIVLELGCGRGDYTVELARRFPNLNFIGIDRKGARLWRGAKTALEEKLSNVAFLRTAIDQIAAFFAPGEVHEIWITFPDPQPRKERRRLTSPIFIERYKSILMQNGIINLKTDSRELYQYTIETAHQQNWEIIEQIDNVYEPPLNPILTEIQTFYEKMWIKEQRTISFLKFRV